MAREPNPFIALRDLATRIANDEIDLYPKWNVVDRQAQPVRTRAKASDPDPDEEIEERRHASKVDMAALLDEARVADLGRWAPETVHSALDKYVYAALAMMEWTDEVERRFAAGKIGDPGFGSNAGRVHGELYDAFIGAAELVRRIGLGPQGAGRDQRMVDAAPKYSTSDEELEVAISTAPAESNATEAQLLRWLWNSTNADDQAGVPMYDVPVIFLAESLLTACEGKQLIEFGRRNHCHVGGELRLEDGYEFGSLNKPNRKSVRQLIREAKADNSPKEIRLRVRLTYRGHAQAASALSGKSETKKNSRVSEPREKWNRDFLHWLKNRHQKISKADISIQSEAREFLKTHRYAGKKSTYLLKSLPAAIRHWLKNNE